VNKKIWENAANLSERGEPFCMAFVAESTGSVPRRAGSVMLVGKDGLSFGTVGGGSVERIAKEEAIQAILDGKPRLRNMKLNDPEGEDTGAVCGGNVTIFLFPQTSQAKLHLFGAGHVARPTAHFASIVGYNVIVYDETDRYANTLNFPDAVDFSIGKSPDFAEQLEFGQQDAVVILSASHEADFEILRKFKGNLPPYLGVIASAKKAKHFRKLLVEEGWNQDSLKAIHAPIGLDIGSRTPEEIALSIVAEILKTRGPIE